MRWYHTRNSRLLKAWGPLRRGWTFNTFGMPVVDSWLGARGRGAPVCVTAAGLQAIYTACQPASKQHLPNRNSNNNANERWEAAQVSESAQASWLGSTAVRGTGDGSFLRASFLNINSIRPRLKRRHLYASKNPPYHFFGIAESWLGPSVDEVLVQIDGFSVIRPDRNINRGK